jgi:hypothetical protein
MSGKGRRWCFMHALQADALIAGAFLAFEAKKSRGDSHGQFEWKIFQHWFKEQFIGRYLSRLSKLNHVVSLTLNHVLITKDRFELQL